MAILALSIAINHPAAAQLQQSEFRAEDGTTYQVLAATNLDAGAEQIQVTTMAGAIADAGSCAATGDRSGSPLSAIGGVLPPLTQLHPYGVIRRTAILVPNAIGMITFDASSGGRVTLGNGSRAFNICLSALDCMAHPNVQVLFNLAQNTGGVPAACIAENRNAQCDGSNLRDVLAFGLAASGNPPVCTTPSNTTINSTVCAARPSDGFTIPAGAAIVFAYGGALASSGFAVAVGGFGITTDTTNDAGCAADTIVSATSDNDVSPATTPPTSTPPPTSPRPDIPTSTATPIATTPTGEPTTVGTPSPASTTPPRPTVSATQTPVACVGDCDGDGQARIDELIRGVNIALGTTPSAACPAIDRNADGEIGILDLTDAVINALHGCRPRLP
ncbi:MAG: hypothetical protein ACRERC_09935 [Candidatus Binatia bacterium]